MQIISIFPGKRVLGNCACRKLSEKFSLCPSEYRIGIWTISVFRNFGFRLTPLATTPGMVRTVDDFNHRRGNIRSDPGVKQFLSYMVAFSRTLVRSSSTSMTTVNSVRYGRGEVQSHRANKLCFSSLWEQTVCDRQHASDGYTFNLHSCHAHPC